MRTRAKAISATSALALVLATYAPMRAAAVSPPVTSGASAYSAAASNGSGSLAASLSLSGSLGGLLQGVIGPIVTNALNPLVAALQASTNSLVASMLGASSGLTAGTPSTQGSAIYTGFPADTWPSPCPQPGTTPCYTASSTNLASSLVTATVPVARGYTQQNSGGAKPIYGRAQLTNPSVSVPFVPTVPGLPASGQLVSANAVNSYAACPNDGTAPSTGVSAANLQVLGGLVGVTIASNSTISSVTIAGKSYTLATMPSTAIAGVNLSTYGSALKVTIPLTLAQVELGLSLSSSVISTLNANATANDALTLTAIIGPNSSITATSASAWGLGIGVDLSGSLTFNLAGAVGATVSVPTGIGGGNYGNVLDARLAYATCKSGASSSTSTPVVPPALI
jgi:hypothetical protein